MNTSKKAIALAYLLVIAFVSFGVLRITEMSMPGLPMFVPLYIGIVYFFIHNTLSTDRSTLVDGPGIYDNHRLANLVIVGALFSALVFLLRQHLENEITDDLHRSLLYWQLLFGFLASSLVPKLIILNYGLIESLISIKPYWPLLVVWLMSFALMSVMQNAVFSLAVITVTTASLAIVQFKSINALS